MRTAITLTARTAVMAFAVAWPAVADPLPTIDWRQLDDLMQGVGDHKVGEELCVRPQR